MTRLAIDGSIALAWCFEDEKTPYTEKVLDLLAADGALVPTIWPAEVTNALVSAERSGRITPAQTRSFLDRLAGFAIAVDPAPIARIFDSVVSLARERKLTTYDAMYLDLALRHGLPLATLWEIVLDLIRRLAHLRGETYEPAPETWYETRYGKAPIYSEILDEIARSSPERMQLLRSYFEPTSEEEEEGRRRRRTGRWRY